MIATTKVHLEFDPDPSRENSNLAVFFPYDAHAVAMIKSVPGARFVAKENGGPFWRVPKDLTTARFMRKTFEDALVLSKDVISWGHKEVHRERTLGELTKAEHATLTNLPTVLPALHGFIESRPCQLA